MGASNYVQVMVFTECDIMIVAYMSILKINLENRILLILL